MNAGAYSAIGTTLGGGVDTSALFMSTSRSMSPKTPAREEILWTCLKTDTDEPNELGDIAMHFTLRHETGVTFVVSVTGNVNQSGADFVNAMRAAAAALALPLGGSMTGARLFSPSEIN